MKLNDKIRLIRKARGMSQMDLGFLLSEEGVSRQAVSNWENGTFEPKLENIRDIAKALGVSIDALLDDEIDLTNPVVLQKVLNNDFKKDDSPRSYLYFSAYRSYRIVSLVIGLIVVSIFLGIYIYGNVLVKSLTLSTIEAPEPSTQILTGINNLQNYVTEVAARDEELQKNLLTMFSYITYISLALMISFALVFIFISVKVKRKVALLSSNCLIIYHKKPVYIKLEDIEEMKKEKFGLIVKTKDENYKINFVTNTEEIINAYNQMRLLNKEM